MRKNDVNEVRLVKYLGKCQNENEIVDISTLPPCRSVLLVHSERANYAGCVWKRSLEANFELTSISDHGWDINANFCWIEEPFPKEIDEILISDEYNENEGNLKG